MITKFKVFIKFVYIRSIIFTSFFNLFIDVAGSLLLLRLLSTCGEGGYPLVVVLGFSLCWFLLLLSKGSRAHRLQ